MQENRILEVRSEGKGLKIMI